MRIRNRIQSILMTNNLTVSKHRIIQYDCPRCIGVHFRKERGSWRQLYWTMPEKEPIEKKS